MTFDIEKMAAQAEQTIKVPVGTFTDATGAEVEVGFTVYGPSSEAYRKADRALQVAATERSLAQRKKQTAEPTDAELAERVVAATEQAHEVLLEHCVAGWYGFRAGDVEAPYTVANMRAVLAVHPKWKKVLVNQIEDELAFTAG